MRLRDLSKTLPRFRDLAKILRDPRFSRYHLPPLHFGRELHDNKLKIVSPFDFKIHHFKLYQGQIKMSSR